VLPHKLAIVDLVRRVRTGDAEASAELVRRYEPAIRITVRARLTDPGLRGLFDSMDICQSVLANFFMRATARVSSISTARSNSFGSSRPCLAIG
jgi:hypothetical protein